MVLGDDSHGFVKAIQHLDKLYFDDVEEDLIHVGREWVQYFN